MACVGYSHAQLKTLSSLLRTWFSVLCLTNRMGFSVVLLTNPMWCSVAFALIGNHMRNHSGQHFVDSQGAAIKENVFSRACSRLRHNGIVKGVACHTDVRSVVWNLINNGKLANQIAKLAVILVKI